MSELDDHRAELEEQLRAADKAVDCYQDHLTEASQKRKELLTELVGMGCTHQYLAQIIGTSRARVGKLLSTGPSVERALLGTGALTVAIAGKKEAPKAAGEISTVVSEEMSAAFELIRETAEVYGLKATRETIKPDNGHHLRLDRANLIVLGSPRVLPLMEQVLQADARLGFDCDPTRAYWHITGDGEVLHSPYDVDKTPADYAYIGRLPRTDGRGTFLYIAGIHSPGTLGATKYVTENVKELYDQVKTRRWSQLVRVAYHPETKKIVGVEPVTEIYYH